MPFGRHLEGAVPQNAAIAAHDFEYGISGRPGRRRIHTENAKAAPVALVRRAHTHACKSMSKSGGFQVLVLVETKNSHVTDEAWPFRREQKA